MAFVITDECLSCGSCAAQCPAEAIDMGELHYEIDQSKCLECGSCAAQCPAEAIEYFGIGVSFCAAVRSGSGDGTCRRDPVGNIPD